jgi:hypothetical protein
MRVLALSLWLCACGAEVPIGETSMSLGTDGLSPSDVGSVMVLVLGNAGCTRALQPATPLDDPDFEVLAHALFAADGAAKHLSLPAGRPLAFYVEAYKSQDGSGARIGRGCAEATLQAGKSSGVSITITASD